MRIRIKYTFLIFIFHCTYCDAQICLEKNLNDYFIKRNVISYYDSSLVDASQYDHGMYDYVLKNTEVLPDGEYLINLGSMFDFYPVNCFQIKNGGYCGPNIKRIRWTYHRNIFGFINRITIYVKEIDYYEPCGCLNENKARLIKVIDSGYSNPIIIELKTKVNLFQNLSRNKIDYTRVENWELFFEKMECE